MEIFLIFALVVFLYKRTTEYYHYLDDDVKRQDYLYVIPDTPPPSDFYGTKPTKQLRWCMIATHCLNAWVVYLLWGWPAALLFAVHPIAVNGTAWVTGNYYATTTFLSLTALYFVVKVGGVIGSLAGMTFFAAALGSTITCIGVPFVFLVATNLCGLTLFFPLFMYLKGKRFQRGYKIRQGYVEGRNVAYLNDITLGKLVVMTKVVGFYLGMAILPYKLCFFREFGEYYLRFKSCRRKLHKVDKIFWMSILSILGFAFVGFQVDRLATAWFFLTILPFSQFKVLGQFVAERYLYLPMIGVCAVLAKVLMANPVLFAILATYYVYRTHMYIPAFSNIKKISTTGIENYPEYAGSYCNLADYYLQRGEKGRACELLYKALRIDPTRFESYVNLAAYYMMVQDEAKAMFYAREGVYWAKKGNAPQSVINTLMKEIRDCNIVVVQKDKRALPPKKRFVVENENRLFAEV